MGLVPLPPRAEGAGCHAQSTHQVSVFYDMVEEEELVHIFCYIFSYMRYLVLFLAVTPSLPGSSYALTLFVSEIVFIFLSLLVARLKFLFVSNNRKLVNFLYSIFNADITSNYKS